ncbi:MAG: hypothetical protein IH948_03225 [Bacteroidetes bacterium]|nr:hypothetical protein [Bacteroidota bacterium]
MKYLLILVFTSLTNVLNAQNNEKIEDEDHHHHKNEISIAAGVVPLPKENKITGGIHLHYIRGIGDSNMFGLGVALETIVDEHKHYTLSIVFQYRLYKPEFGYKKYFRNKEKVELLGG